MATIIIQIDDHRRAEIGLVPHGRGWELDILEPGPESQTTPGVTWEDVDWDEVRDEYWWAAREEAMAERW